MGYVGELSRDQMLLLPTSADDYASADSPARCIAAFVDDLDLGLGKLSQYDRLAGYDFTLPPWLPQAGAGCCPRRRPVTGSIPDA